MQTSMVSSKQALAGASVPRSGAFQSARSASRSSLVVRAQQVGPHGGLITRAVHLSSCGLESQRLSIS